MRSHSILGVYCDRLVTQTWHNIFTWKTPTQHIFLIRKMAFFDYTYHILYFVCFIGTKHTVAKGHSLSLSAFLFPLSSFEICVFFHHLFTPLCRTNKFCSNYHTKAENYFIISIVFIRMLRENFQFSTTTNLPWC